MAVRGAEISGIRSLHCLEYVEKQTEINLKRRKDLLAKDLAPLDSRLSPAYLKSDRIKNDNSDNNNNNNNDNDNNNYEKRTSYINFDAERKFEQKSNQKFAKTAKNKNGVASKLNLMEYSQVQSSENNSKIIVNQPDNQSLNSCVISNFCLPWADDADIITPSDTAYLLAKNSIDIL